MTGHGEEGAGEWCWVGLDAEGIVQACSLNGDQEHARAFVADGGLAPTRLPLVVAQEYLVTKEPVPAKFIPSDLGWDNWTVEPQGPSMAFLVNPNKGRVALMSRARANGIAAALNTSEGGQAFAAGRIARAFERPALPGSSTEPT